jgi:hypothetical protein
MSSPAHDVEQLARERTPPTREELRAHFSELERRLERIERVLAGQAREAQAARQEVQAARKDAQVARKDAYKDLVVAVRDRFPRDRATVECAWVTREGINELLAEAGATGEIDLLSIHIDGNDYWIWEAIDHVSPRIVIIETNPAFGGERAVVVPYDPNFDRHRRKTIYFGASLAALAALADRQGYRLVATEPSGAECLFPPR